MKYIIKFSALVLAILFTSCTSYIYTSRQTGVSGRNIDVRNSTVDIKADFNKRVTGESGTYFATKSDAMKAAEYDAIIKNQIDVVVDPIFQITIKHKGFRAKVTGFAGMYTGQRTLIDEINQFKDVDMSEIEKYAVSKNPELLIELHKINNASENIQVTNNFASPSSTTTPTVTTKKTKK